jgi:hypothetical protein
MVNINELSVEDLKKLVQSTILIPDSIKQMLFEMYPWEEDLIICLKEFFKRYIEIEFKVIKLLKDNKDKIFISALREVEKLDKKEDEKMAEQLLDSFIF